MKEEERLLKKYGKNNPFKVPEGYFDNFTKEIMDKLPEREFEPEPKITTWQRIKPWIYMTAMFCGLMLSVKVFLEKPEKDEVALSNGNNTEISDAEVEGIIDNTMIDDYTLYTYLTEADNEHYK